MPAKKPKGQRQSGTNTGTDTGTDTKRLTISAVARRAGVSTQTVEYYILLDLLRPRRESKTRRRLFDSGDVARVKLIKRMNESGYPLREIRETWLKDK